MMTVSSCKNQSRDNYLCCVIRHGRVEIQAAVDANEKSLYAQRHYQPRVVVVLPEVTMICGPQGDTAAKHQTG